MSRVRSRVMNFTARTCQELALQASLRRILGASWAGSFWHSKSSCTLLHQDTQKFGRMYILLRTYLQNLGIRHFDVVVLITDQSLLAEIPFKRWHLVELELFWPDLSFKEVGRSAKIAAPLRIYGGWAFVTWWLATLECALLHGPEQNRDLASLRLYTLLA